MVPDTNVTPKNILNYLTDPEIFSIGCIPPHSDHFFSSFNGFINTFSLNGIWKFHYAKRTDLTFEEFYLPNFDDSRWDDIEVPSCIQMKGYGQPHYVNTMYPWDGWEKLSPPEIPQEYNPTASYRKTFYLPESWNHKRVCLLFEGAGTALAIWVNGKFAGYHEDSFSPAEFDITPLLTTGSNTIAAQIYLFSSASWLEDQDFWRFSGIFRNVTLYALEKTHLEDLRTDTIFSEDLSHAKLEISALLNGELSNVSATAELRDQQENPVAQISLFQTEHLLTGSLEISQPILWSAETPYLYKLVITIRQQDTLIEQSVIAVGLRKFEICDGLMKINQKRIILKGVNRHEFSMEGGRVVALKDLEQDLRTMKQNNINAIRTSHYPNCSDFYRLCDKYGFYVIDETNLETHGTWKDVKNNEINEILPNDNPVWKKAVLYRGEAMFQRDKNHPCVLIWSCGNESYGGKIIYELSQWFREKDPSRLVHYEGIFHDRRWNQTSDMESRMYAKPHEIEEYLKNTNDKPYISCEYCHAMGNSCGGLSLYTDLEEKYPRYQGGFLWDYIDQAIFKNGQLLYGGDFDDRPTDWNFCGNGIVYADRTPTPKMQEVKSCYQDIKIFPKKDQVLIKNRFLFTNLSDFELRWKLSRNGKVIASGKDVVELIPGADAIFPLPVPTPEKAGEYNLLVSFHLKCDTIWAQKGHEIAFGQNIFSISEKRTPIKSFEKIKLIPCKSNFGVQTSRFHALFSKVDGSLISLNVKGKELLKSPVQINFWRAPTDNDIGWDMPFQLGQWSNAARYSRFLSMEVTEQEKQVSISFQYELPLLPKTVCSVVYTITEDGRLQVKMEMFPSNILPCLPDFGMLIFLPKEFCHITYYGLGPEENYCDRNTGARLGVFPYFPKVAPTLRPQECGNRTETRWVNLSDGDTILQINGDPSFNFSVLPYTPHELENARHLFELPPAYRMVLKISSGQMGVGGDDSWGAPVHDSYMLPSGKIYRLCYTISI